MGHRLSDVGERDKPVVADQAPKTRHKIGGVVAAFFLGWVVYFLMIAAALVLGVVPLLMFVLWVKDLPVPVDTAYWLVVGLKWLKGAAYASAALSVVMVINGLWIEKTERRQN
jgi:hypothetical protein